MSSSVEPVAATIATSSSAAQSNQGGPAESATSSANASQPVSSSVIPAVKTIVASSSAASSKKGHASKPLSVNASQQISSSVTSASAPQSKQRNLNSAISSVAAGFAKLASSTTTSKSSSVNASKPVSSSVTSASAPQSKQRNLSNSSAILSSAAAEFAKLASPTTTAKSSPAEQSVDIALISSSREGSQSVVPQTQPESYIGPAKPLTNFLNAQETKVAEWLRKTFLKVTTECEGFDITATILLQAILYFALPSQHVHPQYEKIKLFLSSIQQTDLNASNGLLTLRSSNAARDLVCELDGEVRIESSTEQASRTSIIGVKASLIPSQIESFLSKSSEFIEENAISFGLSKRILFSIAVKHLLLRDIEPIPLSFPVTLSGRRVVMQTFAGLYDSSSSSVSTPYIRVFTRDTIVKHHGQYFSWDSEGNTEYGKKFLDAKNRDFRSPLPLLMATAYCEVGNNIPLKKLFFIESMSQDEFDPQRTLLNEVVLVAGTGAIKADELVQFEEEVCVDSAIINAFIDVLLLFEPNHPRRQNNIILPPEFYTVVAKIEGDSDEKHKSQVTEYLEQHIRPLPLTRDSILHIPVNFECVHYFYCAVDFSKAAIYICDSCSDKAETLGIDHLPVYTTLCEVLNWELEYRNMATINWDAPKLLMNVMQQKEKPLRRCGVYCMVFLLRGFLEGIFCDQPFEAYNLTKATFSTPFFKLLKKRILCVLSREISVYELLELFVDIEDLSMERRCQKIALLTSNNVLNNKHSSHDFVCKKGWLPVALYPNFFNN